MLNLKTKHHKKRPNFSDLTLKNNMATSDVLIPHFKLIPILLPIPTFRADTDTDTDTADTTDTFLSIEHQSVKVFVSNTKECIY